MEDNVIPFPARRVQIHKGLDKDLDSAGVTDLEIRRELHDAIDGYIDDGGALWNKGISTGDYSDLSKFVLKLIHTLMIQQAVLLQEMGDR